MKFTYAKALCQNLRKALRLEWLETNGCGDYASSSIEGCNTRKYHGLFVADLEKPAGRHVLLSALEETLVAGKTEFPISSRQHPGCFYPKGHEYLREVRIGSWPRFRYRMGDLFITREVLMPRGHRGVLIRYSLECPVSSTPSVRLIIKPLLAYRSFHKLTRANMDLQVRTFDVDGGFKIQPYDGMPPMYMQTNLPSKFFASPDWCRNVEYLVEHERGFDFTEDLFQPGDFEVPITPEHPLILSASLEPLVSGEAEALWNEESARRVKDARNKRGVIGHLTRNGEKFLVNSPTVGKAVIAGYPWFDAWGRDTMIALPGLTFYADRPQEGVDILARAAASMKNGLIPNCYGADGVNSYNSADASLWYIWAVQQMMSAMPNGGTLVKQYCWEPIKEIISAYSTNKAEGTTMDDIGFLHVGTPDTQLTWMDAVANGKPVTPRNGCPVEINALWYNALMFANRSAKAFGESPVFNPEKVAAFKNEFQRRFWNEQRGILADVWREEGADVTFRPNQIFAASLPEPILDRALALGMVGKIRQFLLTSYGLRTLSPANPAYKSLYEGGPNDRDAAYHQGTVWPWLLGAYCDALLYVTWDHDQAARHFLTTVTPLCTTHMADYGVGSICEIFDAAPPHRPNGCIAQAWSVAELLRALKKIQKASPGTYRRWEAKIKEEV